MSSTPIGMFDSGVGGLSVLRYVLRQMPLESVVYVADQAFIPYGQKSAEQLRERAHAITSYLLNIHHCKLIGIPCNTASAAALDYLRETFPNVDFVGMEPAVKPGAIATQSGKVGVLATEGTFGSQRYADLMRRYAADVEVMENPCIGLVELIEDGGAASSACLRLLRPILEPMISNGVDTIVLGCTHYPFVISHIRRIIGDRVVLIDPAPAIARQMARVLANRSELAHGDANGTLAVVSTKDTAHFVTQMHSLIGVDLFRPVTPLQAHTPHFA